MPTLPSTHLWAFLTGVGVVIIAACLGFRWSLSDQATDAGFRLTDHSTNLAKELAQAFIDGSGSYPKLPSRAEWDKLDVEAKREHVDAYKRSVEKADQDLDDQMKKIGANYSATTAALQLSVETYRMRANWMWFGVLGGALVFLLGFGMWLRRQIVEDIEKLRPRPALIQP